MLSSAVVLVDVAHAGKSGWRAGPGAGVGRVSRSPIGTGGPRVGRRRWCLASRRRRCPHLPTHRQPFRRLRRHTGYSTGVIEWYQLNISTVGVDLLASSGFQPPSGVDYFYPAMGTNLAGVSMFTYMLSGTGTYPGSAGVSMDANDNLSNPVYLDPGRTYYTGVKSGACSTCYRWGDFASSYPVGDSSSTHFLLAEETVLGTSKWGTIIGNVTP